MKYLYRHLKIKAFLQKWAKEYALTLASFFLWNLGTEEQKSQGLLRALLYQVLDSEPALAEDLLPKMWYEARQGDDVKLGLPSKSEMT
jgi:DNA-binding transcriptional regulator PaaX